MTFALGTPQRGQMMLFADDRLAMKKPRSFRLPDPLVRFGVCPQILDQLRQVIRDRRLEAQLTIVDGVPKRETERMECLPRKWHLMRDIGPIRIQPFPHQRMTVQSCLEADLIPFAGDESDFKQCCAAEQLDDAIVA